MHRQRSLIAKESNCEEKKGRISPSIRRRLHRLDTLLPVSLVADVVNLILSDVFRKFRSRIFDVLQGFRVEDEGKDIGRGSDRRRRRDADVSGRVGDESFREEVVQSSGRSSCDAGWISS